jgi:hypothetical protein
MRGNVRLLTIVGSAVYLAGCARISGLGDYSTAGSPPTGNSATVMDASDVGAALDPGDQAGDEGSGDEVADPIGDEPPALAEEDDADATGAGAGDSSDADGPSDAGLVPDGYVCGPGTCGGCCSATGDCVGGESVSTCGSGGATCQDCEGSGACSQGACVASPLDAGPRPMCDVASCSTGNCAGFPIQGACCKSDQTCGCQWTIFAPCR